MTANTVEMFISANLESSIIRPIAAMWLRAAAQANARPNSLVVFH